MPRRLYDMARNNCHNIFPIMMPGSVIPAKSARSSFFSIHRYPSANRTFYSWSSSGAATPAQAFHICRWFLSLTGRGRRYGLLVQSPGELEELLQHAARCEASGQAIYAAEYIPSGNRSLRVAVIGDSRISYWRIGKEPVGFHASLSKGARSTAKPILGSKKEQRCWLLNSAGAWVSIWLDWM